MLHLRYAANVESCGELKYCPRCLSSPEIGQSADGSFRRIPWAVSRSIGRDECGSQLVASGCNCTHSHIHKSRIFGAYLEHGSTFWG